MTFLGGVKEHWKEHWSGIKDPGCGPGSAL